ncbi:MAG TPA: murein biosynthesis integral membrane protein MurJ [Coriobacteriia bacterium]|nr:murein biosynthesis integral membrane protein MurJ [Coriobacteriia bacterium]
MTPGKRFSGKSSESAGRDVRGSRGRHFKGDESDLAVVSARTEGARAGATHFRAAHFKQPVSEDFDGFEAKRSGGRTDEQHDEQNTPSVGHSTATMSIATILSRITGFGRTWAQAFALGSTALTSAYVVANNIPNQLYELVAGGVLTTAFLPIYLAQLKKRGAKQASDYASNLLSISAILLGLVALLATIFAPQVITVQTFMADDFDMERAVFFFRFFSIQILFYGVGALINGLLNAHRSFLWPALGPVFQNIVWIVTFIAYPFISAIDRDFAFIWLAVGTTLGVITLFAIQVPALIKLKIPLRFHIDLKDPALIDTLKLAGPAVIFVVMSVIAVMAQTNFATATVEDGVSTIYYAQLWYMLPYGVIAVALATALLTEMSEASAVENWKKFRDNVQLGLRTTVFMIIPLAAILFVLAYQFAGLYQFGAFTAENTESVGAMLSVWCLALPFYATYMFIYRVFSAMRNLNRFVAIDAVGRVFLIALYGLLTSGYGLFPGLGLIGIPLAEMIIFFSLCAAMLYHLRKKIGSYGLTQIVGDGIKILIAALVSVMPAFVFLRFFTVSNALVAFAVIAVFGTLALAIYYWMCKLLKVPEIDIARRIVGKVARVVRRTP